MKMAVMGPVWPCRVYTEAPVSALTTFRVWSVLPVISLRSCRVRQLKINVTLSYAKLAVLEVRKFGLN